MHEGSESDRLSEDTIEKLSNRDFFDEVEDNETKTVEEEELEEEMKVDQAPNSSRIDATLTPVPPVNLNHRSSGNFSSELRIDYVTNLNVQIY